MAIFINTTLTKDGLTIPAGSIIKPNTHFPADEWVQDELGEFTGEFIRKVSMDLIHYTSKADFQAFKNSIGECDQLPSHFIKVLDTDDYAALAGPNAFLTVETWLKDYLNDLLGAGICSIIDPYAI